MTASCAFFVLCFLSMILHGAETPASMPTQPVTQNRDHAIYDWATRHRQVMELSQRGPVDVVMLGDSIFHYWAGEPKAPIVRGESSWAALFEDKTSVNLGFGWDRLENALWRVQKQQVKAFQPKKVVILLGTNNLEWHRTEQIAEGMVLLIETLRQQLPQAHLHVIGVLPRTLPAVVAARPEQVNAELHERLAGKEYVHFHDLSALFLDAEGNLHAGLFSDGLHPNEKGYDVLGKALKAIIQP